MRPPRTLLLAALLALHAATAAAQTARIYPVDRGPSVPSFAAFRARLVRAVERRDTAFVHSVLARDILNSFGGDGGVAEFRETWKPGRPDTELWQVLGDVLRMGGEFHGDSMFAAPYVYTARHPALCEFECMVIVGRDVRVRARPDPRSPVLTTLTYDVVRRAEQSRGRADPAWAAIQAPGGGTGYIARRWIRSPTDYRAIFKRRGGRWYMTALVAGD